MKFTKYAIDKNGDLVYRSNGNLARNATLYNPRTGQKGTTVYSTVTNRKIGTVGKANAKEQKIIDKKAKRRAREREDRAYQNAIDYAGDFTNREWENMAIMKKANDMYRTDETHIFRASDDENQTYLITVENQRMQNFASTLNRMVDNGYMSVDDANDLWEKYQYGDIDERSDLWRYLDGLADEYGLPPSDPITW